ncbi:MAG: MOSC domain-containing protein [Alphaproteobacteria bacterium]
MTDADPSSVSAIYRYPVKGLGPQELKQTNLTKGETIPFDRAWAIENGKGLFNPEDPQHLPKINFLMLMRDERLAALDIEFNESDETLILQRYMEQELRGAPHIVQSPGHSFSDMTEKCVHIVNLASVREIERTLNKSIDPLRFRANIYIEMDEPWAEFSWIDKDLEIGSAKLHVFARTSRCAATNVDPETGARDMAIPAMLTRTYGHQDFGVYAKISAGGVIKTGDTVRAAD